MSIILMHFSCQKVNYVIACYTLAVPNVSPSLLLFHSLSLCIDECMHACMHIFEVRLNSDDILDDFHRAGPATAAFFVFSSSSSRRIGAAQYRARPTIASPIENGTYYLHAAFASVGSVHGILVAWPWPKFRDKKKIGSPESTRSK